MDGRINSKEVRRWDGDRVEGLGEEEELNKWRGGWINDKREKQGG